MDKEKLDLLVTEEFVKFREKVLDSLLNKHPNAFGLVKAVLAGRRNRVGLRIADNGIIAGEYTFNLEGVKICNVDRGVLASEIHHPLLGIIRPYVVMEVSILERMVNDEKFIKDFFNTVPKYLPEMTIGFLK